MVQLITELTHDVHVVCEGKDNQDKTYFIEGVFMQAEKKNRNGRIYPKDILVKETKRYTREFVNTSRAMGELGHPDGPGVNLDRVSHLITSLKFEGNDVIGKAKILDTPAGNIAKSLLKEGVKLGVSTRGMGSIKEVNGTNFVQPDFMLSTVDIVSDPSAPDAFVNGIMEGKAWIWESGHLKEVQLAKYRKTISNAAKNALEETKLAIWNDFLRTI